MSVEIVKREGGNGGPLAHASKGGSVFVIGGSDPVSEEIVYDEGTAFLLIDCSGSMGGGDKLAKAKSGILDFARSAIRHYRVGLIEFSSNARLLSEPQKNLQAIEAALEKIYVGGSTNMAEAIVMAKDALIKMEAKDPRAIVIATDGMPTEPGNPNYTLTEGEKAKKRGIDIITIGTDDADRKFLEELASRKDLAQKVPQSNFREGIAGTANMLKAPPARALPRGKKSSQ